MTTGPDKATAESSREVDAEALLEVARQVADELHPRRKRPLKVSLDSSLDRDLRLDSLGRAELLARLERSFEVGLPESLVATAETPRDLLRAVASAGTRAPPTEPVGLAAGPLGRAEAAPEDSRTLLEVLEWHVGHHPDRRHITFLPGEREPQELTYSDLRSDARSVAAALQELGLEPGQSVALMLPTSLEYFKAFFGILAAGGVPVPLYPPVRLTQVEDHLKRQAGILNTALVRILITIPEVRPLAKLLRVQVESLERVVTVAELTATTGSPALPVVKEKDVAFLQFTSGSTADPKGVILTHDNLLSNLRVIGSSMALDSSEDVIVSWLPLYHDMGLIGAWLGALTYAIPLVLMSPLSFLTRPSRWLWAVHRYRGTLSASPNFGYELCLKKVDDEEIEGLDLSSWRGSLNGAEPVSPETVRRFVERFAPYGYRASAMVPVYGLAESSLALAFPPRGREPVVDVVDRESLTRSGHAAPARRGDTAALRFVGCGFPLAGHEIRIVDATGAEVGERREGRLQFRGPSATSGYFRNPSATRQLFHDDWLDSGDMAYLAGGEVFITGRAKDMIIRAGRNIYPQELEEAVGNLPGMRKGCVAVFATTDAASGTESLVILAETRETGAEAKEHLTDEIQELTVELVGTPADEVVLAPPHTVPKTSSGKIRRAAGRELYEGGKLGRKGPVWWQLTRLAWAGARPQLARSGRAARDLVYAGRFWTVVGLAAVPVVAGMVLLPRLARRRRLAREAARGVAQLASIPIRVSGLEHLEGEGPFVVAANHLSYLDGFALTAALPAPGTFLAKRELEQSFLARLLLERLGTLFVERFDPEKGIEDTERAIEVVRGGESLLFFPEGTLDRAPGLRPFRLGAFYVAARSSVPVVPVAIRGTRSLLRGGEWFPRRGSVSVTVRPPVRPEGSDLAAAARLRDAVRAEILAYCGEPDLTED